MAIPGEKKTIPAIMGASGITKEQAKTCLYYAIATYFLPDKLEIMPILTIIGPHGTGKTNLLKQLQMVVNKPKLIGAKTYSALRDNLDSTITALIDDGDKIAEEILINRYSRIDSIIEHKIQSPMGWILKQSDIFGATIITKREPFKDSAITSRSIIIRTKYKVGHYKVKSFRKASDILSKFASKINLDEIKETSHRVRNNWMPLQLIAEYINDEEWLKYSENEIKKSTRVLKAGHSYEPDISILLVLKEKMQETKFRDDVLLSEIKSELKTQYDLILKNIQIQEYLRELGFKVVSHSGYPKVKFDRELLVKQLKDRQ